MPLCLIQNARAFLSNASTFEFKCTYISYQTHLRFFTPSLALMKSIKNTAEKTLKISPAASYIY